jgi:DNA-binding NtrC family response regulator
VKPTVLYLDDERGCLDVFRETFARGYDVRTAASASEALRMLAERPADVIISDQVMPETSGKEFLRGVASLYPSSYRVLLTGAITVAYAIEEVGAGVVQAFVVKPWTEAELLRVLERAVSTHVE